MKPLAYHEKRKKFYSTVADFWPDLYGEEYALFDIFETNWDFINRVNKATQRIGKIFFKTAKLLRKVDNELLIEMGFPQETLSFLRIHPTSAESVISRLDLVETGNSFKCLELNSDTPTFIKEVFLINELICKEFKLDNPNHGMENRLSEAVRKSITNSVVTPLPNIVFTAHHDSIEDRNTVMYLQKLSKMPSKFLPLNSLQIIQREGLYDDEGKKIDILYRQTFPIENLLVDQDEAGNDIGLWLLELVELGKLVIINPPSAFLLQNKAVQAVIWGLHQEKHLFFSKEEHEWINEYFLPTYFEADPFLKNGESYVKKPSFGREGDTVEIYHGTGELKIEDANKSYQEYIPVYQKYIELPKVQFSSEKGQNQGHMIIGSFLLNGQPGGLGCRVGNIITDNLSYFLPIGIKS